MYALVKNKRLISQSMNIYLKNQRFVVMHIAIKNKLLTKHF